MIFAGNVAMESMGFKCFGFAGGREDIWEPEKDIYWGNEKEWLANNRYAGDRELEDPLAAVQMGLIYVNPEGPDGNPNPIASGRDIRETFGRMAMNDEETVALTCGGHTFGKCHGAGDATLLVSIPKRQHWSIRVLVGSRRMAQARVVIPLAAVLKAPGHQRPIQWDNSYLEMLFENEWELTKSPAGAHQWTPKVKTDTNQAPAAEDATQKRPIIMTTADMAMRMDAIYGPIARRFYENPEEFADAYARAWFKLTHRDMGPRSRYLGNEVPTEELIWQDPIPALSHDFD